MTLPCAESVACLGLWGAGQARSSHRRERAQLRPRSGWPRPGRRAGRRLRYRPELVPSGWLRSPRRSWHEVAGAGGARGCVLRGGRAWPSNGDGPLPRLRREEAPDQEVGCNQAAAQRALLKSLDDRLKSEREGEFTSRRTFEEAATAWLTMFQGQVSRGTRSPSTLDLYRHVVEKHVIPGVGGLRHGEVTTPRLDRFVQAALADRGFATAKVCRQALSGICGLLGRRGGLDANPVRDLTPLELDSDRTARAMTAKDVREGLAILDADPDAQRWDLPDLTRFMLATGLRLGEALGARWSDLDLDRGTLSVERTVIRLRGGGLVASRLKTRTSASTTPRTSLATSGTALGERRPSSTGWPRPPAEAPVVKLESTHCPSDDKLCRWTDLRPRGCLPGLEDRALGVHGGARPGVLRRRTLGVRGSRLRFAWSGGCAECGTGQPGCPVLGSCRVANMPGAVPKSSTYALTPAAVSAVVGIDPATDPSRCYRPGMLSRARNPSSWAVRVWAVSAPGIRVAVICAPRRAVSRCPMTWSSDIGVRTWSASRAWVR